MSRIELSPEQFTSMRHALDARERSIIDQMLQQPDYPPLPPCPECGAAVEQMDSMVEPPSFAAHGEAFLINLKPCGHRFRAAVHLDEPM